MEYEGLQRELQQAKAEVERLTEGWNEAVVELQREIDRLEAQNAALRGNPTSTVQVRSLGIEWPTGDLFNELVEARAEVERLTSELARVTDLHKGADEHRTELIRDLAAALARIPDPDDLRTAVKELERRAQRSLEEWGDVLWELAQRLRATLPKEES
jgi:septal ring factor EnvC (AmiA/AmiB activator)